MSYLHCSLPVRNGLGKHLKPGGEALTERLLRLAAPRKTDIILDAGCGAGSTLELLQKRGYSQSYGADINLGLLCEASLNTTVQADIASLPFASASFDLVTCECVYNLTKKETALAEFTRILKPGGLLALSDIYARKSVQNSKRWPVQCCFSTATDLETVKNELAAAGFILLCIEDHTHLLKQTAAEFVFQYGSLKDFWFAVTGDEQSAGAACSASAATRPGLYLLLAQRV